MEGALMPPKARRCIAESAVLMPGSYVADGALIGDGVTVGPGAVVLSEGREGGDGTVICAGAEIGANATVLSGVKIGIRARIAPGAVVTRSVPPLAIVEGNPARITGYVETSPVQFADSIRPGVPETATRSSKVKGVTFHNLRMVYDLRGNLSAGEFEKEIPFKPLRYFLVLEVPTAESRGEHAHLKCEQFLVAVRGSINVIADDGQTREEFILNRPDTGLYLPPMVWGIQYRYSADAVLLVFASEYYDPADYVRDYAEFLKLVKARPPE